MQKHQTLPLTEMKNVDNDDSDDFKDDGDKVIIGWRKNEGEWPTTILKWCPGSV